MCGKKVSLCEAYKIIKENSGKDSNGNYQTFERFPCSKQLNSSLEYFSSGNEELDTSCKNLYTEHIEEILMRIIYEKTKMNCPLKVFDGNGQVPIDEKTITQAKTYCAMPFVTYASLMPDAHYGKGSTVGSVVATQKVIIPAMVGVDIGCGMMAVKTSLKSGDLPQSLKTMRLNVESRIPHGRSDKGGKNMMWEVGGITFPKRLRVEWNHELKEDFENICEKHSRIRKSNHINHLGSLGGGNHFIEVCLDLEDSVWIMLHSGSRGVGNRIGNYFISLAKEEMKKYFINLPDKDLAYIPGKQFILLGLFSRLTLGTKIRKNKQGDHDGKNYKNIASQYPGAI